MKYTLYKVNNKVKSNVKGIWTEGERIYVDNIHLQGYNSKSKLDKSILDLFKAGEKAVFYKLRQKKAIIRDNQGHIDILPKVKIFKLQKLSIKHIKELLSRYSGMTIYRKASGFLIELWYK
jgi:hypothetical protein